MERVCEFIKNFELLYLVVSKMEITEFGSSSPLSNIFLDVLI